MQMAKSRHRARGQEMFLISLMGDLVYVYTNGASRESICKYRRQGENQGHIILGLVVKKS